MSTSQSSDDGGLGPVRKPTVARDTGNVQDGPAMLKAIAETPTAWSLDMLLDRNPSSSPISDDELLKGIRLLRAERAAIEVKQERAKARKDGVNDDEDTTEAE